MKRRNVIAGIVAAAVAGIASVFASQAGKLDKITGRCYPTADGKFVCKTTGKVMNEPCCDQPCCK